MMILETHRLRGFALPAVLLVSVLILLLILFAYSAVTMNMYRYDLYHEKKQLREDLKSALVLYCADSTLCEVNDCSEVDLFVGHDKVKVSVERCGLYERVRLSNDYPDEYQVLVGRRYENDEKGLARLRKRIHLLMSVLMAVVIIAFYHISSSDAISAVFTVASYTYGPILGMFTFGLFTRYQVRDRLVPLVAIASPIICYITNFISTNYYNYQWGYELLLLNGMLTFIGLFCIRSKEQGTENKEI